MGIRTRSRSRAITWRVTLEDSDAEAASSAQADSATVSQKAAPAGRLSRKRQDRQPGKSRLGAKPSEEAVLASAAKEERSARLSSQAEGQETVEQHRTEVDKSQGLQQGRECARPAYVQKTLQGFARQRKPLANKAAMASADPTGICRGQDLHVASTADGRPMLGLPLGLSGKGLPMANTAAIVPREIQKVCSS